MRSNKINGEVETGTGINKTVIHEGHLTQKNDQTGDYTPEMKDTITRVSYLEREIKEMRTLMEGRLQEKEAGSERVSPERLYSDESSIIKVRQIMNQGLSYISNSLISYNEELERENYIDLFWSIILELQYFLIRTPMNANLEEGVTMLQVALYNHRKRPMNRDEIVALNIVLEKLRNNINLPEEILDECLDKLEEAGFDLVSPLGKVEGLHELE